MKKVKNSKAPIVRVLCTIHKIDSTNKEMVLKVDLVIDESKDSELYKEKIAEHLLRNQHLFVKSNGYMNGRPCDDRHDGNESAFRDTYSPFTTFSNDMVTWLNV